MSSNLCSRMRIGGANLSKRSVGPAEARRQFLFLKRAPRLSSVWAKGPIRWSFAFIDGDHDGEAPTRDALACAPYLETTAMVLFHDLVSPHVAAGLRALAAKGWNVMAYQTAQMMGVAWRGTITPVAHKPDPTQHWEVPAHLDGIPVSGAVTA